MAYIGQQPVVGRYILLDQISGGFNGTTSGFTMSTAGGVQGVKPGLAQNVLLSLGGVIQQPGVDYTISGSGITFTTPPVSGTTFFATVLGDAQSVGTPSDGTVTPASIASGFDFGFPNVNVTGVTTIASGVAATPSLSITGDSDTGLFSSAANTVAVTTSGVQRLSIDGEGNVGIAAAGQQASYTDYAKAIVFGTSSETTVGLVLRTGTSGTSSIAFADNSGSGSGAQDGLIEYSQTDRALAFSTATSERMRIDSSGRLLIGLGTARQTGAGFTAFSQIEGANTISAASLSIISNRDVDDLGARLNFARSKGGSDGSNTVVDNNAELGGIYFWGADGTDLNTQGAEIIAEVDGTPGSNDMPTRLVFGTTSDGGSSPTERLRIDSAGNVGIGTSNLNTNTVLSIHQGDSSESQMRFTNTTTGEAGNNGFLVGIDSSEGGRLFVQEDNYLRFGTDNTERMRIDSDGRLIIGHNSSINNAGVASSHQITGDSAATASLSIRRDANSTSGPLIIFGKSRSTSLGGNTSVSDNDNIGSIVFAAADGTDVSSQCAEIKAQIDGTPGSNDVPGRLVFMTASDGSNAPTEQMRIDNSGRLLLGTATVYSPSGGGSTPVTVVDGGNHRTNLVISNQTNHADAGAAAILAAHGQDWILEATSVLKGNRDFTITAGTNERLRLDNSGRFLYGTTTGVNLNNAGGGSAREAKAYVYNTASVTSERYNLGLITGNNGVAGPTVFLSKTRASSNTHTVVQSGDEVGDIRFTGSDGTFFVEAARIKGKVDGTPGSQDMPGRLEFHTTADGASGTTERMRIDSSGRVGIGTSSPGSKLQIVDTMQATANGHNQLSIIGDDSGTNGESARIFLSAINATNRGCGIVSERQSSSNDHDLILQTNSGGNTPSERMRIDSSGNVGINISNPTQQLHVDCGAPSSSDKIIGLFQSESSRQIYLGWDDSQSTMVLGTLTDHALCIHTSGQNTERIRIDSEGLKFHGDTAAANALNDYEEGTWTPSFGIGSVTVTDAVYTKVGRLVTVTARVSIPNTTNSATVNIGGLPFTPDGFMNSAMGGIVGETTLTTTDRPVATVEAAGNSIRFRQNGATALTFANLSQQTLRWMATYFTDQ